MSGKFRPPAQVPFAQVPWQLAQNTNLSLEAVGLMTYLLSKDANWDVRIYDVEKTWSIGRDKRQRLYAELEQEGYFERVRYQDDSGQWQHDIQVHREPLALERRTSLSGPVKNRRKSNKTPRQGKPVTVRPMTVRPATANPAHYSRKDLDQIELNKRECVKAEPEHTQVASLSKRQDESSVLRAKVLTNELTPAILADCHLDPIETLDRDKLRRVESILCKAAQGAVTVNEFHQIAALKAQEKKGAIPDVGFVDADFARLLATVRGAKVETPKPEPARSSWNPCQLDGCGSNGMKAVPGKAPTPCYCRPDYDFRRDPLLQTEQAQKWNKEKPTTAQIRAILRGEENSMGVNFGD